MHLPPSPIVANQQKQGPEKEPLDLSKGSVIHIEEFRALGFDPKNKYLFIIGHEDAAHAFAFLISSQEKWTRHRFLSRELVHIPKGTCAGLPAECWIQCFHEVQRLSVADLQSLHQQGKVKHKGKLPDEFLRSVRRVIEYSDVLKRYQIQDCLDAIDTDKSKLKP